MSAAATFSSSDACSAAASASSAATFSARLDSAASISEASFNNLSLAFCSLFTSFCLFVKAVVSFTNSLDIVSVRTTRSFISEPMRSSFSVCKRCAWSSSSVCSRLASSMALLCSSIFSTMLDVPAFAFSTASCAITKSYAMQNRRKRSRLSFAAAHFM